MSSISVRDLSFWYRLLTSLTFSTASLRQDSPFFQRLHALGFDDSQYLPYNDRVLAEDHWRPFKGREAVYEAALAAEAAEAEDAMQGEPSSAFTVFAVRS